MILTDELLRIYEDLGDDAARIERDRADVRRMLKRRGIDPDARKTAPAQSQSRPSTKRSGRKTQTNQRQAAKGEVAASILKALADGQPHKNGDIAKTIGNSSTATHAAIKRLMARGLVVRLPGYGLYSIASQNGNGTHEAPADPASFAGEPETTRAGTG